jgi:hypothetical protein
VHLRRAVSEVRMQLTGDCVLQNQLQTRSGQAANTSGSDHQLDEHVYFRINMHRTCALEAELRGES